MSECKCCYCKSKGKPENVEYIRGIQFAVDYIQGEWESRKQGVDRWRESRRRGEITDRVLRSRVEYLESQMKYLGEWHDVLAKEGNKSVKLIKDIDWKHYLFGDHDE